MPGIDYLNQSSDPREDNYWNGGLFPLAFEVGGLAGGSFAAKQYAKRMGHKRVQALAKTLAPSGDSEFRSLMGQTSKRVVTQEARATLGEIKSSYRATMGLSRSLNKYSKIFGLAGGAIMGYQLGKAALSLSRSFNMGADEQAASRRMPLYNGGDEYFDSRAAFTQRQRALQVIHNSQMSTRAAFGEEASYLHY